jgi:hypothetical protein
VYLNAVVFLTKLTSNKSIQQLKNYNSTIHNNSSSNKNNKQQSTFLFRNMTDKIKQTTSGFAGMAHPFCCRPAFEKNYTEQDQTFLEEMIT